MSLENLIEIAAVSRTYLDANENTVEALKGISLSIKKGEFLSIIGPSGCGKTTLLRLIAGLDAPESGKITLEGETITAPDPHRGYVFQQGSLFPWLTVEKNIAAGLKARGVYQKEKGEVAKYLALIGLEGFEKAYPHQISGGMAQRVAIARSLINRPAALLLDEPMGALDSFTRADLQDKLLELWQRDQTTMILVTHDVDEAVYLSDRIVIMTPRPGTISEILDIRLPRPRHRNGAEFTALRSSILEKLHLASAGLQPEYAI
ncbi:Taurine-transporting ATPase [Syntrophobotulus glycolicus DSM 8271]|uniref:Taurine-transporting ATPase n=1 Tax=Syntrophobotulus glycolicus (strain DSM 8271 / FlGlyR) TaxID=645991 RepID=F0SWH7_SYNGF|nr:ABC transporter ATP-binding protein [Syntrophobotulus glycolicus]ADY55743.1 Taurine-transporting ATPase [Syntrophobotulus glycolicus DSM 8271]